MLMILVATVLAFNEPKYAKPRHKLAIKRNLKGKAMNGKLFWLSK
jgi:hypothetical protein